MVFLHSLSAGNSFLVDLRQTLFDNFLYSFAGDGLIYGCSVRASGFEIGDEFVCEHSWSFGFENEEAGEVLAFVSDDNYLVEKWQGSANFILNEYRGHILTTCCDYQLLYASRNRQHFVLVHHPNVS